MKSEDLSIHTLKAISPIDGRHRIMTEPLSEWYSEYAFFKYMIKLEVEYLIALSELKELTSVREFSSEEKKMLRDLVIQFSLEDAQIIQNLDRFGYQGIKATNHDFKAVEYFIKIKLENSSLRDIKEWVHFGLTSEDAKNFSRHSMIRGLVVEYYVPSLVKLLDELKNIAVKEKNTSMLSRTHGQPATPTTFGKEMANYLDRLRKELLFLQEYKIPTKINGAVGNHAAQYFAAPEVDWIKFAEEFLHKQGFEPNLMTTQIEPHDGLSRLFGSFISISNILRDLSLNLWMYISMDYLIQKNIIHEVGSSTMPHKINPWRAEVAEGSAAEATAKFMGFIQKMQVSRLQRDLSDHEFQWAIGEGVAHSYLAIVHLLEELQRLEVNSKKMRMDLENVGSILTEAVQTILRKEGYASPYELMKNFAKGKHCTVQELHQFIDRLDIKEETKQKIKGLRTEDYTGLSSRLTEIAVEKWKEFRQDYTFPTPTLLPRKGSVKGKTIAILGGQWGDEGKGKIIDWAARYFHVSARATGGNNAGHTVYLKEGKHVFHLLPSAITWKNMDCILGNGMVIDPFILLHEIHLLKEKGYSTNNLFISGQAHVILLYHKILDRYKEKAKGDKKVGTTGRGIGPAYADKKYYEGIRINDLLNRELLKEKISRSVLEKFSMFKNIYLEPEEEIMRELIESIPPENFFDPYRKKILSLGKRIYPEEISEIFTELYHVSSQELRPYITDTSKKIEEAKLKNKNILIEGAQGLLLDVDHGTYPYVTSSNSSLGGAKTGLGINSIDEVYSLIKAYTTRIGSGPFVTELRNELGEKIREKGQEYGATTGRPRRVGWHDAVLTRYASKINGRKIIITKLDILSGIEKLKICNSYIYNGPTRIFNGEIYSLGKVITDFLADGHILLDCEPQEMIEVEGWHEDISNVRRFEDLPINAQHYLRKIEELGNVKISLIGVGPHRDQLVVIPQHWSFKGVDEEGVDEEGVDEEGVDEEGVDEDMEKDALIEKKKYKAIIYDMDNTLVETDKYVLELIRKTALDTRQEISFVVPLDEEIKAIQKKNLPFEEIFMQLFPNPANYRDKEPLWSLLLARYRTQAKERPYTCTANGPEVVNSFSTRGVLQGVVTNRVTMAKERLQQAQYIEFSFICQPKEKEQRKPNPLSLKPALDFFKEKGISEDEVLSIGDHTDDFLASRGAGIDFIAILTGESKKEDFLILGLGEEKTINNLSGLRKFIE